MIPVARAFLLGVQVRRQALRVARALALVALGVAALGWLRSELDRRDLEAELQELRITRIELERNGRDCGGALRGCRGTVRGTAIRLGLPEDVLTLAGGR